MTCNEFTLLIDNLPFVPKKIVITGGEPLLNPELFDILSYLESKNIFHTLYTNGFILPEDKLLNLLAKSKNLTNVTISMHSSDPKEHESITRKKGSHKQTLQNIKQYVKYKIPTVTNTVITNKSPHNITEVIYLSKRLGCDFAGFTKFVGPSDLSDYDYKPPTRKRLIEITNVIKTKSLENQVAIDCAPYCEIGFFSEACFSGRAFCSVNSKGDISPCIFSNYQFGNIRENTFENVWHSEKAVKWRHDNVGICNDCSMAEKCLGGCQCNPVTKPPNFSEISESIVKKKEEYYLFKGLRVFPLFDIEKGQNGVFLFNGKHVVCFNNSSLPFLEYLKKQSTLLQVKNMFGEEALNVVIDLYNDNLILLK